MKNLSCKKIREALVDLGDTPEKMRVSLRERGVKGVTCEPNACVLAEYLREEFGRECSVQIGDRVSVGVANESFTIRTDAIVDAFIENFDNNQYPELVK